MSVSEPSVFDDDDLPDLDIDEAGKFLSDPPLAAAPFGSTPTMATPLSPEPATSFAGAIWMPSVAPYSLCDCEPSALATVSFFCATLLDHAHERARAGVDLVHELAVRERT